MSWASTDLTEIDEAQEIVLLMHRDGHDDLRVPVWAVVTGGQVFVRSWKGAGSVWFRRVIADAAQAIGVGGRDIPVRFEPVGEQDEIPIADGYRAKYRGSGEEHVDAMVAPKAVETTARLSPR